MDPLAIVLLVLVPVPAVIAFSDIGERQDWPDWENDDDHVC